MERYFTTGQDRLGSVRYQRFTCWGCVPAVYLLGACSGGSFSEAGVVSNSGYLADGLEVESGRIFVIGCGCYVKLYGVHVHEV